jgi:hypothetical protein
VGRWQTGGHRRGGAQMIRCLRGFGEFLLPPSAKTIEEDCKKILMRSRLESGLLADGKQGEPPKETAEKEAAPKNAEFARTTAVAEERAVLRLDGVINRQLAKAGSVLGFNALFVMALQFGLQSPLLQRQPLPQKHTEAIGVGRWGVLILLVSSFLILSQMLYVRWPGWQKATPEEELKSSQGVLVCRSRWLWLSILLSLAGVVLYGAMVWRIWW